MRPHARVPILDEVNDHGEDVRIASATAPTTNTTSQQHSAHHRKHTRVYAPHNATQSIIVTASVYVWHS